MGGEADGGGRGVASYELREHIIFCSKITYTYMHAILEQHTYSIKASLSHNSERANWDGSLGEGERERERERRETHTEMGQY